jgi:hypothetical protein
VLLIVAFAVFEWRVQLSRIRVERAGLVFPVVCAAGGALLLTHSHSLGNVKEEFLAELSHIPLALLAVMAGWSRWLELRLCPGSVPCGRALDLACVLRFDWCDSPELGKPEVETQLARLFKDLQTKTESSYSRPVTAKGS